jgi:hypothetical protein
MNRHPHWATVDAWADGDVIRLMPGETSLRQAKARLGLVRPELDPHRERVRCEAKKYDPGIPECWHEAHETVADEDGDKWDLCPDHADELRRIAEYYGPKLAERPQEDPEPSEEPVESPRPVPDAYSSATLAAEHEARVEARWQDRKARGIPTTNIRRTKSRLGRTKEYRRIEKRRQMARRKGLDPDTLGAAYRLPRRDTRTDVRAYGRLVKAAARLGIGPEDE